MAETDRRVQLADYADFVVLPGNAKSPKAAARACAWLGWWHGRTPSGLPSDQVTTQGIRKGFETPRGSENCALAGWFFASNPVVEHSKTVLASF
jgi:hypothetical protein